jgi:protein-S-isoprenylcysteine O-methyltransferase Ste14
MDSKTIYQIGFWALIVGVLLMRVTFMLKVRRSGERLTPDAAAVQREGLGSFLFRVAGFLALLMILVSTALGAPWVSALAIPFAGWLRAAGFFLGVISLGLWTWAQVALGALWSPNLMLRKGHRLITTGPYARIRHPLYAGMIGWSYGLGLVSANWIFVILAALVSSVFVLRIPREERMLAEEFGEEYRGYARRTGSLFPRL